MATYTVFKIHKFEGEKPHPIKSLLHVKDGDPYPTAYTGRGTLLELYGRYKYIDNHDGEQECIYIQ